MQRLPYDQIIAIQAARAFANLAPNRNRPRSRRRETRRQPHHPHHPPLSNPMETTTRNTFSNITRPYNNNKNTPYSHIQVIQARTAAEPEPSIQQPTFSTPSLEIEAAQDENFSPLISLNNDHSRESLANNANGTTFAAKARAAELQASRARRELRANVTESEPHTSHNIMTFKSKNQKWKPLNLNNLPGPSDETVPLSHQNSNANLAEQGAESDVGDNNLRPSSQSKDSDSSDPLPSFADILKRRQDKAPSLAPKYEESVASYNTSQWDPDLPPPPVGRVASLQGSNVALLADQMSSLEMKASADTMPPTTGDTSYYEHVQAPRPKGKHADISDFPNQTSSAGFGGASIPDFFTHEPSMYSPPKSRVSGCQQFPTYSSNSGVSRFPDFEPAAASSINTATARNLNDNFELPMIKPNPPRHYPAVKGTMGGIPKLSQAPRLTVPESIGNKPVSTSTSAYHKFSAEEEKGMLLKQLREMAETAGTDKIQDTPRAPNPTHNHDADLVHASDPLPWKERPVDVVSPPSNTKQGYPSFGNYQLTPTGVRDLGTGLPADMAKPTNSRAIASQERLDSVEDWWHHDGRVNDRSKQQIASFLTHERSTHQALTSRHLAEHQARLRSNFPSDQEIDEQLELEAKLEADREKKRTDGEVARDLLLPVLANLKAYSTERQAFNQFGEPPAWCMDQGPRGNESFFGGDWGAPPPRVGRDPRYRAVQHDGRSSVFEDFGGKWGSDFRKWHR